GETGCCVPGRPSTTPSEVEWQDARLDTYRCRDAKSGAARETRPSRSKKRLLKTALRDNYLEKRRVEERPILAVFLSGHLGKVRTSL
ncbi:hypothetical protein, partial [Aeromonas caviae]|uniref:hypothetical protein n=1 Tax=Aeromonas caviae TaxID=648 RepID=UPI001C1F7A7A